jgi:hypothetical protein
MTKEFDPNRFIDLFEPNIVLKGKVLSKDELENALE